MISTAYSSFSQDNDSIIKANMSYIDWFGENLTMENLFLFANMKASYGQYDLAVEFFSNLLINFPKFNEEQRARTIYEGPIDSLSVLTIRAYCLTKLKKYDEAIQDYHTCLNILRKDDPLLKSYPENDDMRDSLYYWDLIGDNHVDQQKYDEALEIYNNILKRSKENERTLSSKINCLHQMNNLDEALKLTNKSLKKYPQNILFHKQKAEILIGLNETEKACQILKTAMETDYLVNNEYPAGYFDPILPEIKTLIRENCR